MSVFSRVGEHYSMRPWLPRTTNQPTTGLSHGAVRESERERDAYRQALWPRTTEKTGVSKHCGVRACAELPPLRSYSNVLTVLQSWNSCCCTVVKKCKTVLKSCYTSSVIHIFSSKLCAQLDLVSSFDRVVVCAATLVVCGGSTHCRALCLLDFVIFRRINICTRRVVCVKKKMCKLHGVCVTESDRLFLPFPPGHCYRCK
jgi:hypothetical protein